MRFTFKCLLKLTCTILLAHHLCIIGLPHPILIRWLILYFSYWLNLEKLRHKYIQYYAWYVYTFCMQSHILILSCDWTVWLFLVCTFIFVVIVKYLSFMMRTFNQWQDLLFLWCFLSTASGNSLKPSYHKCSHQTEPIGYSTRRRSRSRSRAPYYRYWSRPQ